ncbi:hypothetical protein JWZ98_21630 [Methylomonas sp. EFPC1]|uniref:hypothetical protein n=1 Tax=Methylomonas sp. EFPC1 TaxID=2812647 RepID=UPI001966D08E|nr:hypothetical protein [Methylomonas sp. EFPC1]QSB01204.1 hypothetical protein JWZ98_21630 [Methylomonas sp. EFPC1]
MLYDNPAARLKAILEFGMMVPRNKQCRLAWEEILGAQPGDTADLFAKLGKAMELPKRTILLVQTHFPHQLSNAGLWHDPIESAFINQQLGGQWTTFIEHINPYCIPQVGLISDLIHSKVSAKFARDEDISNILDGLKALIDLIDQSTISEQLKNYLAQELGVLVQSVRDYKISGATPILRQAESMVGHTLLDPEYSSFLTNHELGQRLLDNLNAMAAILTVAMSLPQLAQGFIALLPK